MTEITTDVLIVGASLAGAAAAKRTVDAGFRTIMLESKKLPRHKICSGILSPRGYAFLQQNFGEPPDNAFHDPKWVTGVNFLFPNGLQLPMPFIPGPTPHIYRKFADYHAVKASRAEIHEQTEFRALETNADGVFVKARKMDENGKEVVYRAKYLIAADGPRSEVATAGAAAMAMGAVLMNQMGCYVGSLAAASRHPVLTFLLGWHPWAIIRIISFVTIGVVLSLPLLRRLRISTIVDRRTPFALLSFACAGLIADVALKYLCAPYWQQLLRRITGW